MKILALITIYFVALFIGLDAFAVNCGIPPVPPIGCFDAMETCMCTRSGCETVWIGCN